MARADLACLKHLAAILIDARRVYARAARIAEDPETVDRIERTMAERDRLLREISNRIAALNSAPPREGAVLSAAHKAFFDVRSFFDHREKAALAEVRRGEKYLRDEIRKAIRNETLSAETRAFLGLALDRIVNGEMRIEGKLEEVEHLSEPHANESIHPIPPHH